MDAPELLQQVRDTCYSGGQPDYSSIYTLIRQNHDAFADANRHVTKENLVGAIDAVIEEAESFSVLNDSTRARYVQMWYIGHVWVWQSVGRVQYQKELDAASEWERLIVEKLEQLEELKHTGLGMGTYAGLDALLIYLRMNQIRNLKAMSARAREKVDALDAEMELGQLYLQSALIDRGLADSPVRFP